MFSTNLIGDGTTQKGCWGRKILKKPTLEQWEQLYNAASEFKQSECWRWMYDDDNFAVVDLTQARWHIAA